MECTAQARSSVPPQACHVHNAVAMAEVPKYFIRQSARVTTDAAAMGNCRTEHGPDPVSGFPFVCRRRSAGGRYSTGSGPRREPPRKPDRAHLVQWPQSGPDRSPAQCPACANLDDIESCAGRARPASLAPAEVPQYPRPSHPADSACAPAPESPPRRADSHRSPARRAACPSCPGDSGSS